MSGERDAVSAGPGVRPFHHVYPGPVMLQEIQIDCGEPGQRRYLLGCRQVHAHELKQILLLLGPLQVVDAFGEQFDIDGLSVEVIDAERRRITRVRMKKNEPAPATAEAP